MKLSRRRKNAKRVIYTRRTKYHCKKYKNKQTYRKHSHKLKKNKRVMRGGVVEPRKPYNFEYDEQLSLDERIYKLLGDLTYKRGNGLFTGTKTKQFNIELKYDHDTTMREKTKNIYIKLSTTGGNNTQYDRQLYELLSSNSAISATPWRQVFAVFNLKMTSTDVKQTTFVVYLKVDTAVAIDTRDTRDRYLKAFITYSPNTNFDEHGTVIETPFMKVTDSPVLGGICSLFKNAGLVIPDQGTNDKSDICYFSCKDNSDFFWKLTYTMVKTATDIELKKIQSAH